MIPIKSLAIAAVAGLLAVAGLAACGDDESSDSTSTTAALSAEDLTAQANDICAEHAKAINSAVDELFSSGGQPSGADVRTIVKETILPHYSAQIGQLDQLEPPSDQADAWDQWITDSTATRDAIKDDPNTAFDASAPEFKKVNDEASALGLGEDCQVGPQA